MKIVIKVGTSTLAYPNGSLNIRRTEELCKVMSDLKNAGHEIILALKGKPTDMPTKQAAAAVGQCELMYVYDKLFSEYSHTVAQILLTASDVRHDERHGNFTNTMNRLLELGVLPIINENDTVSTEEISIGDNDTLAAIVAVSVNADLLILLSDIDGLYDGDPRKKADAKLIPVVRRLSDVMNFAGEPGSALGTGGMRTKLHAAEICSEAGCDTVIANGAEPMNLYDIASGKPVGTRFIAEGRRG